MMTRYGYVRVWDLEGVAAQRQALREAGATRIIIDIEGIDSLITLLEMVKPQDVLYVTSLDRLGSSVAGVLRAVAHINERKCYLVSINDSVDFREPSGQLVSSVLGYLAACDSLLMNERAASARRRAAIQDRQVGRPSILTKAQMEELRALRPSHTMQELVEIFGVSRPTLYRALAKE